MTTTYLKKSISREFIINKWNNLNELIFNVIFVDIFVLFFVFIALFKI